jgi:UV DNA damage endonuclease
MQHHILVDSTSYTFYRVTATAAWWKLQSRTPIKDIVHDSEEYHEFLQTLRHQSLSSLQKFCNRVSTGPEEILFVRDCPRDTVWRLRHFNGYKANREGSDTPSLYGHYIKHLNQYHATLFPKLFRIEEAEADDVIAVLVQYFKYIDSSCRISIIANDSDYNQLMSYDNVCIYNPRQKFDVVLCDNPTEALRQKVYHGDRSDNVPSISPDASYSLLLRNNQLVNFNYIPRYIQDRVVGRYHELVDMDHTLIHRPMPIQLGLCCINTELQARKIFCSRTLRLQTLADKGLGELYSRARQNCRDLITYIKWNAEHGIRFMRISSDIFPHMNNPQAPPYTLDFAVDLLREAGRLARLYRQRLTFHPGQYNVVGTPDERIFQNTVGELDWHAEVLDLMGCDQDSVIVIHGGGVYGNKQTTIHRWIKNFSRLPERVQRRLVIENCERSFSVVDCLQISTAINIPVVFDTHHFQCYLQLHRGEAASFMPPESYMSDVLQTWSRRHIKPKFHVSDQCEGKQIGAHSDLIEEIPQYLLDIPRLYGVNIDIMVEAKLKEQAINRLYIRHPELDPGRIELQVIRPIKAKLRAPSVPALPSEPGSALPSEPGSALPSEPGSALP